jgi:N-acetylglucosaminyldiphosphoundecaprenol N-acetyl-beta-D-mannosaminyltransferase
MNPLDIPLVILGVPFHRVNMDQMVDACLRHIRAGKPGYIATPNLDFVMQAGRDPELYRILAQADFVIADGMPIVSLSRHLGPPLPERVAGSDLVVKLAEAAAKEKLSIFNLGGMEGIPEKAGRILCERYPGLRLAGFYSPPKGDVLEMDHEGILKRIADAKPDILYVAFGAPKQEKWINMHVRNWKVPLALGIGGSLDFLAGAQIRAPRWMQRSGIEWIWRFGTNPKRLWKRYASNLIFLLQARRDIQRIRRQPLQPNPALQPAPALLERLRLFPWRELHDAGEASTRIDALEAQGPDKPLLIDLSAATWLTSLELGVLLTLGRHGKERGYPVLFTGAAGRIREWMQMNGLDKLLLEVPPGSDIEALLQTRASDSRTQEDRLVLTPPPELTAASLPAWREQVREHLEALTPGIQHVEVDASRLSFIDSASLGYLVGLKKNVESKGLCFSLSHLQGAALTSARLARVDKYLQSPATP